MGAREALYRPTISISPTYYLLELFLEVLETTGNSTEYEFKGGGFSYLEGFLLQTCN
jgi:hypothetical protein